jgi:hypothetical protein
VNRRVVVSDDDPDDLRFSPCADPSERLVA